MKKLLTLVGLLGAGSLVQGQTISAFPYTQDFEAFATCGTGAGTPCTLSEGWFNPTGDDIDWTADVNGTGSSGTGPTANGGADYIPGVSGGLYLYLESSATAGNPNALSHLESPWFDFTALTGPTLEFGYHMFGTSQGTLAVEIRTGLNAAWTGIVAPMTDNLDAWQLSSTQLPTYAAEDSVQFRFVGITGTSFGSDMAIDGVTVFQPAPYDLAYNSIDSVPTSLCATATAIQGYANFTQNGTNGLIAGDVVMLSYDDGVNVFTDNVVLTAPIAAGVATQLPFTTLLDYSVPALYPVIATVTMAADANASNDSIFTSVNVSPLVNVFPYYEDFEGGTNGWSMNNATNGSWAFGTPTAGTINSASSGINAFGTGNLTGNYNTNEHSYVESVCFDMTTATGNEWFVMDIWKDTEDSWDGANIWYSIDGGSSYALFGNFNDPNNWFSDNSINGAPGGSQEGWDGDTFGWESAKHDLPDTIFTSSDVKFRVYFGSDGSVTQNGFAFDNVGIAVPPSLDILPDSLTVCDTLYVADGGAGWAAYEWSTGGTSQIDTISGNGTYVLTVFDSIGLCATDTITLAFSTYVPANFPPYEFHCMGGSTTLDAGADSLTTYTYDWSNAATTQTITVTTAGWYSVTKTDSAGACSETDSVEVIVPPVADLGPTTAELCAGATLTLDANVTGAFYNWNTGASTQTIDVTAPGGYAVTVVDSFGCLSTSGVSVIDGTPVVTLGNDLILCADYMTTLDAGNAGSTYLWSTNETTQTINIDASTLTLGANTYTVTVTSPGGCTASDDLIITVNPCTGVEEVSMGVAATLFPNPTNGVLNVAIEAVQPSALNIKVLNLQGQVMYNTTVNNSSTAYTVELDLEELAAGTYLVQFQNEDGVMTQRIIKQ